MPLNRTMLVCHFQHHERAKATQILKEINTDLYDNLALLLVKLNEQSRMRALIQLRERPKLIDWMAQSFKRLGSLKKQTGTQIFNLLVAITQMDAPPGTHVGITDDILAPIADIFTLFKSLQIPFELKVLNFLISLEDTEIQMIIFMLQDLPEALQRKALAQFEELTQHLSIIEEIIESVPAHLKKITKEKLLSNIEFIPTIDNLTKILDKPEDRFAIIDSFSKLPKLITNACKSIYILPYEKRGSILMSISSLFSFIARMDGCGFIHFNPDLESEIEQIFFSSDEFSRYRARHDESEEAASAITNILHIISMTPPPQPSMPTEYRISYMNQGQAIYFFDLLFKHRHRLKALTPSLVIAKDEKLLNGNILKLLLISLEPSAAEKIKLTHELFPTNSIPLNDLNNLLVLLRRIGTPASYLMLAQVAMLYYKAYDLAESYASVIEASAGRYYEQAQILILAIHLAKENFQAALIQANRTLSDTIRPTTTAYDMRALMQALFSPDERVFLGAKLRYASSLRASLFFCPTSTKDKADTNAKAITIAPRGLKLA